MSTTTRLFLTPADHGRRLTLEGFIEAEYEGGFCYELARGVVEVTRDPGELHGLIVCFLYDAISNYRRQHPSILQRHGGGGEIRLFLPGRVSIRNPDVAVVLQGTPKNPSGHRPPALVMEVVSRGADAHHRDHVTKREEYLAYGVHEYWIIDPIARRVLVLVRRGDAWVEHVFQGDQAASGRVLPGFAVRLPEMCAEMEKADGDGAHDPNDPPAR